MNDSGEKRYTFTTQILFNFLALFSSVFIEQLLGKNPYRSLTVFRVVPFIVQHAMSR